MQSNLIDIHPEASVEDREKKEGFSGMVPFIIDEVNEADQTVTLTLRRDMLPKVSWALRSGADSLLRSPNSNPHYVSLCKTLAGRIFAISQFLFGQLGVKDLVDLKGQPYMDFFVDRDGNERECRS